MTTSKPTVHDVLQKIEREAREATSEVRFVRTVQHGDEIRQGDVYLYAIETPETDWQALGAHALDSLQLAPGTSPGARHIIEGDAIAYAPMSGADVLTGPMLHARNRVMLTHPEHADISLPAGHYLVRYQRDFSHPDATSPRWGTPPGQMRDPLEEQARMRRVYD